MRVRETQTICEWAGTEPQPPASGSKLGLALSTIGKLPIHGIRHLPANGTCGWYIWCGNEFSEEPDFFAPLHVEHLAKYLSAAVEYLDLPPGYRFLIDGANYEDVWFDSSAAVA